MVEQRRTGALVVDEIDGTAAVDVDKVEPVPDLGFESFSDGDEEIGLAAIKRRARLEQVRDSAPSAAIVEPPASLLNRMKKYLRLA